MSTPTLTGKFRHRAIRVGLIFRKTLLVLQVQEHHAARMGDDFCQGWEEHTTWRDGTVEDLDCKSPPPKMTHEQMLDSIRPKAGRS